MSIEQPSSQRNDQGSISGMVASVIERLDAGEVIIGDGSYVFTLEKRGYVQAGKYKYTNTRVGLFIQANTNI